MIYAGHLVLLG